MIAQLDERAHWLDLGSDVGLRNKWFTRASFALGRF
jgi:hypothetical protein